MYADDIGCLDTPNGIGYIGPANTTVTGYACKNWLDILIFSAYGFLHYDAVRYPDGEVDHNKCRNPLGSKKRPWCHSDNPDAEWEYCTVPLCGQS